MKSISIHKSVIKEIEKLELKMRSRIAESLDLLAHGESIGMPLSRPMPGISPGAHELRFKDRSGQYRVFYYTKIEDRLIVFHFIKKKTQATPKKELEVAKKRLGDMI